MLHLAIISIACAVSALNEDNAITQRKNNEFSTFCLSDEGKQNIAKLSFPRVYNVDVNNSSDCDRQKNRTGSFYDYIINQYRSSRNNSCRAMNNVSYEGLKNSGLNVDFAFRTRNLLWEESEPTSGSLNKKENRQRKNCKKKRDKVKSKEQLIKELKSEIVTNEKNDGVLSPREKKLFLRLKAFKVPESARSHYLDSECEDVEEKVQKFCKKMELENRLRKEKLAEAAKSKTKKGNFELRDKTFSIISDNSVSFLNKLYNIFSFRKNSYNKNQNGGNSALFSVNLTRLKNPVVEKTGFISIYDTPQIMPGISQNSNERQSRLNINSDVRGLKPIYRKNLFAKPYPYSTNFKSEIHSMHPHQKFITRKKRKRQYMTRSELYKPQQELKNWPFFKNSAQQLSIIRNMRRKRHRKLISTKNNPLLSFRDSQISRNSEKSLEGDLDLVDRVKKSKVLKRKEKKYISSLNTFREMKNMVTEASRGLNPTQKYEGDVIPDHTIERPFLKRDFQSQEQDFGIKTEKYNITADSPLVSPAHDEFYKKYINRTSKGGFVPYSKYIKVYRALRRCHAMRKRKRCCGGKTCSSMPRKCWRSAPLLCIPYIRKGQEDILKYLIQILEKMLGKPIPPKKDIFGRTKYKPLKDSGGCDDSCEDECDPCDSTSTSATVKSAHMPSTSPTTVMPSMGAVVLGATPSPDIASPGAAQAAVAAPAQAQIPVNAIAPQVQKKNSLASSQDCPFTAPPVLPTTLKANPAVNCEVPSNLLVTPSLNNGWLTNPPILAPAGKEITTQGLNKLPNQPDLYTTSAPMTPAPSTLNEKVPPGVTNPEIIKSSTAAYTNATAGLPAVTEAPALATSVEVPHASTMSPSTPNFSNTPSKQKELIPLTPHPNTVLPEESTTQSDKYFDLNIPKTPDQKIPDEKEPQLPSCDNCGNLPFNLLETHPRSSGIKTSSSVSSIADILRYSSDNEGLKKNEKDRKHDPKKHLSNRKGFNSDDYLDENHSPDQDLNFYFPRRKFHQKKIFYPNFLSSAPIPNFPFDYDSDDEYPLPRSSSINKMGSRKHLKRTGRYHSRRSKIRKIKDFESENSLARRKREDDYIWPEIYSDYGDESNYRDRNFIQLSEDSTKASEKNASDDWAPPFDDMFNELAKAVSGLMTSEANTTVAITTDAKNITTTPSAKATITPITTAPPSTTPANVSTTSIKAPTTASIKVPTTTSIKAPTTTSIKAPTTTSIKAPTTTSVKISQTTATTIASTVSTEAIKSKSTSKASTLQTEKHTTKSESRNVTVSTTEKKSMPAFVTPAQSTPTTNSSRPIRIDVISSKSSGKLVGARGMNNLKSGKTGFFQNSKANLSDLESSTEKVSKKDSGKEDKKGNQDSENGEGQVATTLKMAVIVKGPKKLVTKPSPKVFSKVYPDSFDFEIEGNETTTATTVATSKPVIENKTALLSSTLKPDTRLQLLAVCEGYLEIIKRIKASNQTFGENLDAELAQYCESIISQSFNTQVEKPRKAEPSESSLKTNSANAEEKPENNFRLTNRINLLLALQDANENDKKSQDSRAQDKIVDDGENSFIFEKSAEIKKNLKYMSEDRNLTETEETPKSTKKMLSLVQNDSTNSPVNDEESDEENEATEEGILKRGISEEQVNLIKLLKKRKRALMSWLMNSKDQYKTNDLPETEYFDDEDYIPPDSDFSEDSGTIKPKRREKSPKKTTEFLYFNNKTLYPVYAKRYGYDKDGEVREVEVLWRKINEKTHEEKILKNMSVIAFLMTSTSSPTMIRKENKLSGRKGFEGEDLSENELNIENRVGFAQEMANGHDNTSPTESEQPKTTTATATTHNSTEKTQTTSANSTSKKPKLSKSPKKNETHTFISKPEVSSIVGTPPSKNKTHQNITRKVSHKFGVAKDIFQEYSIEFLNYAVYILPAMFTILFLFCCFGCALYILKTRKSFRKFKKKKKRSFSSDESSETSDDSEDSPKKRKRDPKRKKKSYAEDENFEKKIKKKFWNVLKMPNSNNKELNEENGHSERKNFLRFLKGRKGENKAEGNKFSKNYPDSGDESDQSGGDGGDSGKKEEKHKVDGNSESVERRELISLLEELKKIELEQTGEKKEVKSVQVQYGIEHDENPFQRPEFSYPYEKNIFGLPKGYFFCSKKFPCQQTNPPVVKDFELYGDVSETTELLPCECDYYSKKNDYFRHCDFRLNQEGRSKRIYKIYRDSGVNQNKSFGGKNFMANDSENQNFIFDKYRSNNSDISEELVEVNKKNVGTDVRLNDSGSPFRLLFKKNTGFMEELGNMRHHLRKKKYVRLKDDGVLCRL